MARILDADRASRPFVAIEVETARTRVFLLYGDPDEPGWARAWLRHGSRATRDAVAPAAPIPADLDVRPRSRAPTTAAATAPIAPSTAGARAATATGSTRAAMSTRVPQAVIRGHHAWDRTRNTCGYRDQDNIASRYLGRTGGSIHTRPDGRSIVDRGR